MFRKNGKPGLSGSDPLNVGGGSFAGAYPARDRIILVISPYGLGDSLIGAIEHEFRFLRVVVVPDMARASMAPIEDVDLIVIDRASAGSFIHHREVFLSGRAAPIAVLVRSDKDVGDAVTALVEQQMIKGVISTDTKLEIILSVFKILLCGGEYLPVTLFRRAAVKEISRARQANNTTELTAREWQILSYAATGSKNRSIADELNLSEHTVKIHIHNIIRKLGVHNRTEAAAYYFANKDNANIAEITSSRRPN